MKSDTSFQAYCAVAAVLLAGVIALSGCSDGTTGPSGGSASVRLSLRNAGIDDLRTYSVGRVQLRALDTDDEVVSAQIFDVDRATGLFLLDFVVPAGPDQTLLVEPLGSAVLLDGGKTNSGVALQAIVEGLDVIPDEVVEVEAILQPFIPDSVFVGSRGEELELFWSPMALAESHRVRVIEEDLEGDTLIARVVDVARDEHWGSVLLDRLRVSGAPGPFVGFQVQSINRFAESAFSDTAFYFGP
jgi:hypothetical protein